MTHLKYVSHTVVCQEVQDEVSLAINISGCPHHCAGCHSSYLAEDIGEPLLDNLDDILAEYGHMVTCVCYMGGDHNLDELYTALYHTKALGFKICLYSGRSDIDELDMVLPLLDYVKVGPYVEELGGLSSKTTNQVMYKHKNGVLFNITDRFWRERTE